MGNSKSYIHISSNLDTWKFEVQTWIWNSVGIGNRKKTKKKQNCACAGPTSPYPGLAFPQPSGSNTAHFVPLGSLHKTVLRVDPLTDVWAPPTSTPHGQLVLPTCGAARSVVVVLYHDEHWNKAPQNLGENCNKLGRWRGVVGVGIGA
jgi:hypothetical protein